MVEIAILKGLDQDNQLEENMSVSIKVFASNFPAISIVMGALLLVLGYQMNSSELITWGGNLIIIGAVLQVIYLFFKYGRGWFFGFGFGDKN